MKYIDNRTLSIYLFLAPSFLLRFAYGSDNNYVAFSLGWVQIIIGLVWRNKIKFSKLVLHLVTFILIFIHFLIALLVYDITRSNSAELTSAFLNVYVYLFFSLIFALVLGKSDLYVVLNAFSFFAKWSILISIFTMVLYSVTDISVLINNYGGKGWARAQAFMTEPSGMSFSIALIIGLGICRKDKLLIILGALGLVVVQSATAYLVVAVVMAFLYFIRSNNKFPKFIIAVLSILLFVLYWSNYDCSTLSYDTVSKIMCGTKAIFELDNEILLRSNERLNTTVQAFELMSASSYWLWGLGLNSSSIIFRQIYENIENSLVISFYIFFGFLGLGFLLYFTILGYIKSRQLGAEMSVLYVALTTSIFINSAGGFYSYMLFFFLIYILIYPSVKRDYI